MRHAGSGVGAARWPPRVARGGRPGAMPPAMGRRAFALRRPSRSREGRHPGGAARRQEPGRRSAGRRRRDAPSGIPTSTGREPPGGLTRDGLGARRLRVEAVACRVHDCSPTPTPPGRSARSAVHPVPVLAVGAARKPGPSPPFEAGGAGTGPRRAVKRTVRRARACRGSRRPAGRPWGWSRCCARRPSPS